ncbi:hypothetical protein niasHT_007583 [Heterodera trifolii]|uniref:Uncharacterized protein n=1 Tax=Heterodera trifolii TaxID=157864 RepID=A0ABD2LPL2_9BILA
MFSSPFFPPILSVSPFKLCLPLLVPFFPLLLPLSFLLLPSLSFCGTSLCPAGQIRFGPCIGDQCPPTCPGVCTCVGRRDCCTDRNAGGGGDGIAGGLISGGGASLPRLLLALLLGTGRPGLPSLQLALCRDNALNCPLFLSYCQLPPFSLCMYWPYFAISISPFSLISPLFRRIHCTATCGGCGDDSLGLLLAQLLFGGLTMSTTLSPPLASGQLAIRDKMPRIREIQGEPPKAETIHKKGTMTTTKCPAGENQNGTTKNENVTTKKPQKTAIIHRKKSGGTRRKTAQRKPTAQTMKTTTTTARPPVMAQQMSQQFAVPPGLTIPKQQQQQQQQLIRTLIGRGREGQNILMRERNKLVAMLMRRFMGG